MPKPAPRLLIPAATLSLATCEAAPPPPVADFGDPWTTAPGFEFGEGVGGDPDASFAMIATVRALGDGSRVLVVDVDGMSPRATIWTPDGSFVTEVGRQGDGPGEFASGFSVLVREDGFHTADNRRFTSFANDGSFIETFRFPPRGLTGVGLLYRTLLEDGSVLAKGNASPLDFRGFEGRPPIESLPVVRLSEHEGQWIVDTIAVLDTRNYALVVVPEGVDAYAGSQMGQFFGDYDLTWFDPVAGTVVVVRRNLGAGRVELLEIDAAGDTVRRRLLAPPPVSLTAEQLANNIDNLALLMGRHHPVPLAKVRAAVEEALYVPDPLPGAMRVHGTVSGEIWLNGFETEDSLGVWYSVAPGDEAAVRKVLLPAGFRAMDATATHVWGVRRDELGVEYVAGLRLVSPGGSGGSGEGE